MKSVVESLGNYQNKLLELSTYIWIMVALNDMKLKLAPGLPCG